MKETANRFLFSLRYAYKNIIKNPLRSILLMLSLIALMTSLLLATSSSSFMTEYFIGDLKSQYRDLDLIASVGTAGNSRYFTLRTLNDDPNQGTYMKDVIPFFEIDTLVSLNQEKVYVKVMSSSIDALKKISNVNPARLELSEHQVIITQSLADDYNLSHGDEITMQLTSSEKTYVIIDIIDDGGLMSGKAIYLNKNYSLPFFLSALNPALSGLPEIFFANLYNTLYIDIEDEQTASSVTSYLHDLPGYSNLFIRETINLEEINEMIDRNLAVFSVIFVIVIFAILLVMSTTMMVYFEEKKKMVAIIDLLGGRSALSYGVILLEFMLFFMLSAFASVAIGQWIVSFGMRFVGSSSIFELKPQTILLTLGVSLFLFVGASLRYYLYTQRSASIREVNEHINKDPISITMYIILIILSILLYIVASIFHMNDFGVILRVISIVLMTFTLPFLLIKLLVIFPAKTELFFHLKMLIEQKSFRQYTSVLLLSFLSIFLLVLTNTHMEHRFTSHRSEYQVDYVLTNFITGYDETLLEIESMTDVEHSDPALIYENIIFTDYGDSMLMTVSMEPSKLSTYFDLPLSDDSISSLLAPYPVIILPERYRMLYHLNIGDTIISYIHPDFPNVEMVIGGFFEKYIANLAFTNLHTLPNYAETGISSIFVNGTEDSSLLYPNLIEAYSQNLVYVLDYQQFVESNVSRMERATLYMTVILIAIILCFVLSIINHSLLLLVQMRKNDARMSILGLSRRQMILLMIRESIGLFIPLFVGTFIGFTLLSFELTDLILWSGEYENITLSSSALIFGSFFVLIVFIFTRIVYIVKLLNIQPSIVLRTYE